MPLYNWIKYNKNYSKTSGSLWNYCRDELTDKEPNDNGLNKNVINSKSFIYKTESTYNVILTIIGGRGNPVPNLVYDEKKESTKEIEIAVPLKHLGNFWNSLDMPLVNSEVSLALSWSATCLISSMEEIS